MDPYQIKRLEEEHQKGLYFCEENIKKWEKFKTDYEVLKERLETLPDSLSYDVTLFDYAHPMQLRSSVRKAKFPENLNCPNLKVPFGNNAFTKGKIVHTNEIMVLLGENWFAEVSAKQAVAITTRRILQCTKMLEDLSKEKKQFENWLNYISEVSAKEELIEIVEDYDEEKEKSWKEQHAKNVKSHRLQLAEKKLSERNSPEEDIINKLEELELAEMNGVDNSDEDSKSEFNSEEIETMDYVRNSTECSDEGSHSEEHPEKNVLKLRLNCNTRKTSESETGDDYDDNHKRDMDENSQESTSPKNGKHVRWQDLSKQNIKRITFKHSKPKKTSTPSYKYKAIESSEDENHPLIQSPSDIYKHFGNLFQSPPKSILKVKTPSPSTDMNFPIFPTKEDVTFKESSPETDDSTNLQPFTGEVRQRSSPIDIVEPKSSRPMSHFKSSRKNRKR